MQDKIDPKVQEILAKYHPNPREAVWFHKQSKQWLAKHKALEIIAAKAGIKFQAPVILQFDLEKKIAAFIVTGRIIDPTGGIDDRIEWSVGEATAYNSINQYYGSMAEKRGKDRVILKLIGLHGDVYSDQEIEVEKPQGNILDTEDRDDAKLQFLKEINGAVDNAKNSAELAIALSPNQLDYLSNKLSKQDKVAYDNFKGRYDGLKKQFKDMEQEDQLQQYN